MQGKRLEESNEGECIEKAFASRLPQFSLEGLTALRYFHFYWVISATHNLLNQRCSRRPPRSNATHLSSPQLCLAVFTALILSIVAVAAAEQPASRPADPADQFAMELWRTERGMPQDIVTALLQTRNGYIWAATYNGIAQFDGIRFTIYNSSNTEGLTNSSITSLYEDAAGDVWIGHDTGEVTRFSQGVFKLFATRSASGGGTIAGIGADRQGDIWAMNLRGEVLRLRDGLFLKPPSEMTSEYYVVPQMAFDTQKRLLVVRNGIVAEITPAGFRKVVFEGAGDGPYFGRLAPARAGGWWVADDTRVRRWAEGKWQEEYGPFPGGTAFVVNVLESSSGQLFIGTLERGVLIYDRELGWMRLDRHHGLPRDWVRSLAEDRERNIWVGTSGGLVVLRPRKVVMCSPPDGWQGRPVLGVTMTRGGEVWAATEGAGIYRMKEESWTQYGVSSGLSNMFAWCVMEDSRSNIWAGTWGGGLFRWNGTRFIREFDLAERGEPVTALLEDPAGVLWIGSTKGLLKVEDGKLERLSSLGGPAAGDVRALGAGPDGELWIGTQGDGLGVLKNGELRSFSKGNGLASDFILCIHHDQDGTVWIGTMDRGICRFKKGVFSHVSAEQGLPSNDVGHIEDDGLGNLWCNSQNGVFRVGKKEMNDCAAGRVESVRPLVFGKAEGLTTMAGSSGFTPSGFKTADGRVWFPTAQGIAIVSPKSVRRNYIPPSVLIEELMVDGHLAPFTKPHGWFHKDRQAESMPAPERGIELQPGQQQIDISFTGISFTSPERVHFQYRLDGLDSQWSESSVRRRVTYPFLPPGRYTFRVRAANNDGVWSQTGDAVAITVLPYFWQTWWFKAGLVLVGFSLVGGVVYLESRRRHRLKLERVRREHELERERARIAQDIHDDLGASLTRIGMLSQSAASDLNDPSRAAAELNAIYTTARDLTRAMDEIVWAVNPRHDTLESLANYITRYAHDFLSAAHIRCRLEAALQMPELTVHSEIRHNLFLAFKEALNNAVKHSRATEVRVSIEIHSGELKVVVDDNGSGFEREKAAAASPGSRVITGYGVGGIQARLEQIGGRVELQSSPGRGTQVSFHVPVPGIDKAANNETIQF